MESQGDAPVNYKQALTATKKDYDAQGENKGTYQVHPDNRMTLWNMIDQYKDQCEVQKEKNIVQKTKNAAAHFRRINNAQMDLD